jgi:UDP-N-acetylglucosamine 2-epimerase (non-hydrolysing)
MADVCLRVRDAVLAAGPRPVLPDGIDPAAPFLVATLHRAENTDDRERLAGLVGALTDLPVQVALLAHPRLLARAELHGIKLGRGAVRVGRPLPYAELVATVLASAGVVTDSGGLQKEAYLLARPCTTLRPETEWVETLADGWNVLVPDPDDLGAAAWAEVATRASPGGTPRTRYGDGRVAERVVDLLVDRAPG